MILHIMQPSDEVTTFYVSVPDGDEPLFLGACGISKQVVFWASVVPMDWRTHSVQRLRHNIIGGYDRHDMGFALLGGKGGGRPPIVASHDHHPPAPKVML